MRRLDRGIGINMRSKPTITTYAGGLADIYRAAEHTTADLGELRAIRARDNVHENRPFITIKPSTKINRCVCRTVRRQLDSSGLTTKRGATAAQFRREAGWGNIIFPEECRVLVNRYVFEPPATRCHGDGSVRSVS